MSTFFFKNINLRFYMVKKKKNAKYSSCWLIITSLLILFPCAFVNRKDCQPYLLTQPHESHCQDIFNGSIHKSSEKKVCDFSSQTQKISFTSLDISCFRATFRGLQILRYHKKEVPLILNKLKNSTLRVLIVTKNSESLWSPCVEKD